MKWFVFFWSPPLKIVPFDNQDVYSRSLSISQNTYKVQSVEAVEYTHCISTGEVRYPLNSCPRYDTKPSDGEVPTLENVE